MVDVLIVRIRKLMGVVSDELELSAERIWDTQTRKFPMQILPEPCQQLGKVPHPNQEAVLLEVDFVNLGGHQVH